MGDSAYLKEMGQRIMARRKSLRMTQEELSEKLAVSTQMISNLELGKKRSDRRTWRKSVRCLI